MGIYESLEEDIKKANETESAMLDEKGNPDNGKREAERETVREKADDAKRAGKRISTRRNTRHDGAPSPDEDEVSSEDAADAPGEIGNKSGDGEGTSEDDDASQGTDGAPRRGDDSVKTPQEAARERREKRDAAALLKEENERLKRDLEEARRGVARAPEQKQETTVGDPEPDKEKDLAGWLVWNAEQDRQFRQEYQQEKQKTTQERERDKLISSAKQEIKQIEDGYRKTNPDYDNAINHARKTYSEALKIANPHMSDADIEKNIDDGILKIAVQCAHTGQNFGDVMYDMAIERFRYNPEAQQLREDDEQPQRAALRTVASNQRRSATGLQSGGQRGKTSRITVERALNMTSGELQALPPEDQKFLASQGF